MTALKARVLDGHLVLNECDEMDEAERERLHTALDASLDAYAEGKGRPAEDVLAEIWRRNRV